jgi:pSer/pThr/pTyr-binding forkhead associated (FHA) protein
MTAKSLMAGRKRPTDLVDVMKLMSFHGTDPVVLYQISGPGRPRRFRLPSLADTLIGRDEECLVVLDDALVSKRHAKISFSDRKPEIVDLSSSGGTALNGKRIETAYLKDGDQIQIGTSLFQVTMGKDGAAHSPDPGIERAQGLVQGTRAQSTAVAGTLREIRLPSLLQVLDADRITGTLVVRQENQEGKLYIVAGGIRHATLGRAQGVRALYRMMALEEGRFELFIPGRSPEYETVDGDLQRHLLEAMRQKDEFALYRKRLPAGGAVLGFNERVSLKPARVPAPVYEVMAAVGQHKTLNAILELCPLPDFEICRVLLVLLDSKLLTVRAEAG